MKFVEEYVEKSLLVEFHQGKGDVYQGWVKISRIPLTVDFLAGEKYYKLSPKSILELDGEIRCYYEGNSLDPNCAACKSLGRFSYSMNHAATLSLFFHTSFYKLKQNMKTIPSN